MNPLLGSARAMLGTKIPDGWTYADVSGLAFWYEAELEGLADSTAVATATAQGGVGQNLTQSTTNKKPTYKTGIINGRAVYRFDGTDDVLVSASKFTSPNAGTWICVMATRAAAASTLYCLWCCGSTSSSTYHGIYTTWVAPYAGKLSVASTTSGNDFLHGSTTALNGPGNNLLIMQSDGSTTSMEVNRTTQTVAISSGANDGDWWNDAPATHYAMGSRKISTGEAQHAPVDVALMLGYDSKLGAADLAMIKAQILLDYGV